MKNINLKGQALVSLLVFMLIALAITTGAVFLLISNSINTTKISQGSSALNVSEAGMEIALVKMLRDPSYTGETIEMPNGEALIEVTGSNPYTLVSTGIDGDFVRKIEVSVEFVDNEMSVVSWKEIF